VIGAEGLINGCALETLSLRTRLAGRTQIWADVHELTSRPLAGDDFISAAVDAATFGAADALIVTRPTIDESRESVRILRDHVPHVPLIIGGGIDESTVAEALDEGDGVIIGRALKPDGSINGPVDMLKATEIAVAAGRGRIGPTPRDRPPRDRR
jgi:predicted TIM-barrel enzyme